MHRAGLRVVMDVVYNHTGFTETSLFNQLAPGYYYRQNAEGGFSNASACGNEIASERPMARKFIVESVVYWAKEYHIDGFRFDLMGIHDLETMREIRKALDTVDPTIFIYGEGWTAGDSRHIHADTTESIDSQPFVCLRVVRVELSNHESLVTPNCISHVGNRSHSAEVHG